MKKLFYLFLGIIGISSCTNDNFIEPLTETTNSEIIHEKLTYEQVSKRMDEKIDFNKGLKNTFKENFISSTKDLMKINNTDEEDSEILIDYFFDPVHDNATYSFITHEFSGEGDYLEKFVLTVEEGEEKVALLRYYPTTDFSAPLFSGKIEVSTLDRSYVGESYIENGITITPQSNGYQTNSVNVDCLTTISIKSTRCGNPGNNHRYGEQCAPGFTNNAYLYVTSFTTCNTTITSDAPVFSTKILEPDPMSGGGGDGSNIVYEQFYQQLSPTFQNWLKTQPNTKNHLLAYLLRHRNSTYYENIAEDLIEFLANDDYLKTNFNPLTEFVLKEALNGNKFNTTEFINFWDNLTNNQKDIFQQYANTNKQYLNGAIRLKPEAEAFLSWAFNYLIDNPTVTVEQFENWFSLEGSLNDDLIKELQPYTTLKFDEFININKDLDDFNVYLQNSNPLDSPWLKQAREYAQKLESWSSSLGPKAKQKARETIDETFKYALNKTAQYLYSNVGNLTEIQKETQFQNNGKNGVAILLHDFANGLGKNTRNFPLNYDITQQFIAGNVLNDIKSDFLAKLIEKNLTYNQFVSNGNTINGGYAFSPDHTSAQDSFDKHVNANWVQFFIGGASTVYQPTNDYGWISVTISNSTSRSSLMLHVGDNYPRNGNGPHKPLSTISQTFTFRMKVL